jgi:type I restriction enzyme S subunit
MSDPTIHEWKNRRIGEICEILDSRRVPVNATERNSRIGPYPYYGANGIQGYIDDYIFDEPTVLLAEDGGYFDEYASRPIAQYVSGRYWVNNHAHVLRGKSDTDTKWLFYSLVNKNILRFINGGTRAKLNQSDLIEISVHQPPLAEQQKIAVILTAVDEVIENTEAEISKLEDLKKATMNELLTKGIGHTDFKETEIGRIPKSWEVKTLQELCVLQRGHDLPTQNRVDGNVPIYGSNGIVGFHSTTDIEPNGVVTGRSGSIGDVYFVSGRYWPLNTTLYVVNFRGNDRRFVRMFLQNFRLERFATGTGVPTLNRNDLHPLRIRVPPIREQEDIVSTVGAIEAQLDAMHRSLESKKKMRNALLSDLLTGKVRVKVN